MAPFNFSRYIMAIVPLFKEEDMKVKFDIKETLRRRNERRVKRWLAEMMNSAPVISMDELERICGEETQS